MARLAIRATGDRSKRENVTTGDSAVLVRVNNKNILTHTIRISCVGDITTVSISEHTDSATSIVHHKCAGVHESVGAILQCTECSHVLFDTHSDTRRA